MRPLLLSDDRCFALNAPLCSKPENLDDIFRPLDGPWVRPGEYRKHRVATDQFKLVLGHADLRKMAGQFQSTDEPGEGIAGPGVRRAHRLGYSLLRLVGHGLIVFQHARHHDRWTG